MTKMATISLYGKNLYKASYPEPGAYDLTLGMHHWGLKVLQIWCKWWTLVDYDLTCE